MEFNIVSKNLPSLLEENVDVKGIVVHSHPEYFDNTAQYGGYDQIVLKNKDKQGAGFHYGIDEFDIVEYTPKDKKCISCTGSPTYISTALYGGKPEDNLISIHIFISERHDYEQTEKYLVSFLISLLKEHNLTEKDLWRGFDLSSDDKGPFYMLDNEIWEKFLNVIKDGLAGDDNFTFDSPFKDAASSKNQSINDYVISIFKENKDNLDNYMANFKPDDKNLDEIKNAQNTVTTDPVQNKDQKTGNHIQFQITHNPPGTGCSCQKAFDKLDAEEKAKDIRVEPVYPDLITPPGGDIKVANGNSETKVQSNSNTALTVEEFEKRQKTFDVNDFADIKKNTTGRPVNCEDPFPVDQQIKKLEEHFPKVKVDRVKYDFTEDNHLGSQAGAALAKNYNMCYDIATEVARRTETRLVKLENNLSTVMRNLFRMSARVSINCQYYGGQSVYGKYNCIRCLQDDRINDGAVVSLDQCLCCTRYEPIEGQVYAILNETGSNMSQVIDDMQMSYMSIDETKEFGAVNEMHNERKNADLTKDPSESPKPFIEDKWLDSAEEKKAKEDKKNGNKGEDEEDKDSGDKSNNNIPKDDSFITKNPNATDEDESEDDKSTKNGFIMSWTPTILETQKFNVNEYKPETEKLYKPIENPDNQDVNRNEYKDTREEAKEYEKLEFDIKDYVIQGFGQGGSSSSTGVSGGGSEARKKICAYAQKAADLGAEGKAKYSLNLRDCHDGHEVDGIAYWDCSSLARDAYASAGITGIGNCTFDEYPHDLDSAGGLLIPISNVKDALPGDMMWFSHSYNSSITKEQMQTVDTSTIHHVAIYMGDNKWIEAKGAAYGIVQNTMDNTRDCFGFGRPKELIELDKQSSTGGVGYWDKDAQNISDELWNAAGVAEGQVNEMISNMQKYGYKDALVNTAKAKGFDPYFIAAIITVESTGNPNCGGGYPGLMQVTNGSYDPATNISQGCDELLQKEAAIKPSGWTEDNLGVLCNAYNCGEGIPIKCHSELGVDLSSVKIGDMSGSVAQVVKEHWSFYNVEEKRTYPTKICRAYIGLYNSHCLD